MDIGRVTVFGGADTMCFFNGMYMGECMQVKLSRNKMTAIFAVSSGMEKFLYLYGYMNFHLLSINEYGDKGLISGICKIKDWVLDLSIDELTTEVTVEFDSKLDKILGHLSSNKEDQDKITEIQRSLPFFIERDKKLQEIQDKLEEKEESLDFFGLLKEYSVEISTDELYA